MEPGRARVAARLTAAGLPLQAADSKREQFRRYLEKSGVMDTLTKGKAGGGPGGAASLRGLSGLPPPPPHPRCCP